jgi:hypothetical protein
VVGTGSAASCTFSQLQAAATKGGVITFNCGSGPVTIPVTATLNLPTTKNTVIDGGNKITLDGGNAVQILRFDSADFQANTNGTHAPTHHAHQRQDHAHPGYPHRSGALFAGMGRRRRRCPVHARRQPHGDRFDLHEQSGRASWA